MRINLPINNQETVIGEQQYLISKTDLKGRITYANQAFVQASGFAYGELLGKAHNIVRHPHMPPAAYQDLWNTIQQGRAWTGTVINRTKNGGFYWVYALVSPTWKNGEITGYSSVRVKPTKAQVDAARALYQRLWRRYPDHKDFPKTGLQPTGWKKIVAYLQRPWRACVQQPLLRYGLLGLLPTLLLAVAALTKQANTAVIVATVMAQVVLLLAGVFSQRHINQQIQQAEHLTQQIAAGNLAFDPPTKQGRHQTLAPLLLNLDMMRKGITGIATEAQDNSQATQTLGNTLSAHSHELIKRTDEQNQCLQAILRHFEHLRQAIQSNNEQATQTVSVVSQSQQAAAEGEENLHTFIESITQMQTHTQAIGQISGLIEQIAFRTNLLAINAAIEAARAGESGRGFAVVAHEVRQLAQRSTEAAADINELIEASSRRIEDSVAHARHSHHTIQAVLEQVGAVHEHMHNIQQSSSQQMQALATMQQALDQTVAATGENEQWAQVLNEHITELGAHADHLQYTISVLETS